MWSHQSQPLYDDIGRFYTILLKLLQWIGVVTDVRLRARTLPNFVSFQRKVEESDI